jgi:prepilin-type N-terminal cleavage/methylation domain-containing protein
MQKRKGYNVIELLVVITAISLIMAIGYKGVNVLMNNIKAEQLASQLRQIQVGMGKYYADTGTYPTKLSLLLEKGDTEPTDGTSADAFDAVSVAFYGPGNGDTVAAEYWAGPYVEGMKKQGDCIKSVVGYEICLGAVYTADGTITQLYTTTWNSDNATGKSIKQDANSNNFFNVLSVRGIEAEMAINLFKSLNKRAIDNVPSNAPEDSTSVSYNRNNILNNSDTIGVGTRESLQQTKTIVYRYTQAF